MNNRNKNLRELIINWQEDNSLDKFNEILKLIKEEKFFSPTNELNTLKIEYLMSLDCKFFIPAYINIEKYVTDNKTSNIYTLRDYLNILEEKNNVNIEGLIIEPDDINLFLNKKNIQDICNL